MVSLSDGIELNTKNRKLLAKLFRQPKPKDIKYQEVERLLLGLGAIKSEKAGSNVAFFYNGHITQLHIPHPDPTFCGGRIKAIKEYLITAGVVNENI
ncbi:ferredoxin reductase domain-containing protein [Maridesulfovibrio frigidus]|uniref:hypothetical protein n=1 Tax=Maridesulfovibrio frigidus TaxID=340956 RepID=UPI0004E1E6DF|nr:hypothetical protein [Maridesulfovibrio frigidus]